MNQPDLDSMASGAEQTGLFESKNEATLRYVAIDHLEEHPDNPRLCYDDEVIDGIATNIEQSGHFSEEHAILVRPAGDGYQIISGHHRVKAAKRAGLDEVPAWVREMDDDEAYMLLVTENNQGELEPIEIGMHALEAVGREDGGRGNVGGFSGYAERIGHKKQSVTQYAKAAEVYKALTRVNSLDPSNKTRHLYEISKADETLWPVLIEHLVEQEWSVRDTKHWVGKVREFEIPDRWEEVFLPKADVVERFLDTREFAPSTVDKLVSSAKGTVNLIEGYDVPADEYIDSFESWLDEHQGGDAWDPREIRAYQRRLTSEIEAHERDTDSIWDHGDWREHIDNLDDESVRLVLTDPPYGVDFKSDYKLDRREERRHERIENDTVADATKEIGDCLSALYPKLEEDAHVLCFTHWKHEPKVRNTLEAIGYTLRGSLVWDKQATGMGDPDTTFAPKHERILHVVKGSPQISPRHPDVLACSRIQSDEHPTEKPTDLLETLIEATTTKGELVVDPLGGVASTLVAALENERQVWGSECEREYYETGRERLLDV